MGNIRGRDVRKCKTTAALRIMPEFLRPGRDASDAHYQATKATQAPGNQR